VLTLCNGSLSERN